MVIKMEYYFLTHPIKKGTASAHKKLDIKMTESEFILSLQGKTELPFTFELKNVGLKNGELFVSDDLTNIKYLWLDSPPNSFAWPLFSERMRAVVEENMTGKEGIDWIKVKVQGLGETRTYYVLRFNKVLDVLDKEKTVYSGNTDFIVIPMFSSEKVKDYSLFYKPTKYDHWRIPTAIYVSERLKKAMQKAKLTGINFSKARVS